MGLKNSQTPKQPAEQNATDTMTAMNYYLMLDLDFDPPVRDEALIRQRIEEKSREWSEEAENSNCKHYGDYLRSLEDLKTRMSDPDERTKIAREAKALVNKPLRRIIGLYLHGGYIKFTHRTLSAIAKQTTIELERQGIYYTVKDDYVKKVLRKKRITVLTEDEPEMDYDIILKTFLAEPYETENLTEPEYQDQIDACRNGWNPYHILGNADPYCLNTKLPAQWYLDAVEKTQENGRFENPEEYDLCNNIFYNNYTKARFDKYLIREQRKSLLRDAVEEIKVGLMSDFWYWSYITKLCKCRLNPVDASYLLEAYCVKELAGCAGYIPSDEQRASLYRYKTCRNCGSITDTFADGKKVTTCSKCGMSLFPVCPKCGADLSDCPETDYCKCGYNIRNIDRARALLSLAKKAVANIDISTVEVCIGESEKFLPNYKESEKLKKAVLAELDGYVNRFGWDDIYDVIDALSKMKSDMAAKRFFAANKTFQFLQEKGYKDLAIENEINYAISYSTNCYWQSESFTDEKVIMDLCSRAYEICTDNKYINAIAAKYPPKAPENLRIDTGSDRLIYLEWDESKSEGGEINYIIIRKENSVPQNVFDGERIDNPFSIKLKDEEYHDFDIIPGVCYYYAVFAERAGIISENALTNADNPAYCLFSPDFIGYPKNGAVLLKWKAPPEGGSAVLFRSSAGSPEEEIYGISDEGYLDSGLENNREYTYRLRYTYTLLGKPTDIDLTINITPIITPEPIDEFTVEYENDDRFTLYWKNPDDYPVTFYWSTVNQNWNCGDTLPLRELKMHKNAFNMEKITKNGDIFSGTFTYGDYDTVYIRPVVFESELAVLGKLGCAKKSYYLRAYPKSNAIELKWLRPPKYVTAELFRSSTDSPNLPEEKTENTDSDGYLDSGLENNREYTYRLRYIHVTSFYLRATATLTIKATPKLPPET